MAAAGEVVPGYPARHRSHLLGHRRHLRGDNRVVRHTVHRPLPEGTVRLCRRSDAVVIEGHGIRFLADDGQVSAIHPRGAGFVVSRNGA